MPCTTRDECLGLINTSHNLADDFIETALTKQGEIPGYYPYIADEYVKGCFSVTKSAILNLIYAVRCIYTDNHLEVSDHILYDMFSKFTTEGNGEITWEQIVAAWANADITGRIFTVASIDFMRQEIWNEPVTSFALAPGGLGK